MRRFLPVYLVSGWWRSGTTMMMRALSKGGLPVLYDAGFDVEVQQRRQEFGNPQPLEKFYEINRQPLERLFSTGMVRGHLIKMFVPEVLRNTLRFPYYDFYYQVVYMHRPIAEIKQSWEKAFPNVAWGYRGDYWNYISERDPIAELNSRENIELVELNYKDVVADPLAAFELLKEKGWPIDPVKAAGVAGRKP